MEFVNETLVTDNGVTNFYRNNLTDIFNKSYRYSKHGLTMLLAEIKESGERLYILLDKGNIIYDSENYENVCCHADMVTLSKTIG